MQFGPNYFPADEMRILGHIERLKSERDRDLEDNYLWYSDPGNSDPFWVSKPPVNYEKSESC